MSLRACLAPLALVLAAAGCSLPHAVIPPGHTTSSGLPPSTTSTPPDPAVKTLAAIQACDLLSAQELSLLGLRPQGRPSSIVGLRSCDWSRDGGDGVATSVDEQGGIDELNLADASSITDITIGRHRGKRAVETSGPGYCNIFFAIGNTASVTVQALYLQDTARACAAADKAAAFVEPKLP